MEFMVNKQTGERIPTAGITLYADLPVGSWVKNDMTPIPTGFLKEGDTISATEYPELYAMYGSTVPYKADTSELSEWETSDFANNTNKTMPYDGVGMISNGNDTEVTITVNGVIIGRDSGRSNYSSSSMFFKFKKNDVVKFSVINGNITNQKVAYYKKSLIVKAKAVGVPTDFTDSLIGYVGKETNYNLYPWSHVKSDDGADINQDVTIDRDGWYSIDYTMTSNTNVQHTFTLRDFDTQGDVHTIMRFAYDKAGTFRQTFLVPLKAGTYRYSHGGIGTLSVYMNRRDFAY